VLVFALNATDASSTWFAIFKVIHVSVAVFWVGGGLLLTALAMRAERARNSADLATIARQAAFAGERLFAPAGLVVLAMGIAMVINRHIGWGTFWVDAGLVGYAAIGRILLIARVDLGLLLLVIADMLLKPFS